VLISVNPFRDLGIYTEEVLASYRGKNRLEMPPHVFAVAESSYYNMKGYKENQCIIIRCDFRELELCGTLTLGQW
jgi:myosin-1